MSSLIQFYKMLTEDDISRIEFSEDITRGYYFQNQEEVEIEVSPLDDSQVIYQIEDAQVNWDPGVHDITLTKTINIASPQYLFGEDGIVDEAGEIGIGVRWYAKASNVVQAKEVTRLTSSDRDCHIDVEVTIEKGTLRGNLVLELFMTDAQTGRNIGELTSQIIAIDGDSSLFPIQEVEDKDGPLWWVSLDYTDPLVDEFDLSNVSISLNYAHRHANHLKVKRGITSSPLMIEIISSALEIIVNDVKDHAEWDSIMNNESLEGSIGATIHYFINTFNWDLSSGASLAKSIRTDLENRL